MACTGFREEAQDAGRDPRDLDRLAAKCRSKVAGGVSSIVLDPESSSNACLKFFCGTTSGEIHTITLDRQVGPLCIVSISKQCLTSLAFAEQLQSRPEFHCLLTWLCNV